MNKLLEWIKRNIFLSIIITIGIFMLPILLIHIAFKTVAPYKFLVAEWSPGEMLQFYGSFLSFMGTVLLGGLALWQNNQLAKKNEQFNLLIANQQKQMNMPKFEFTEPGSNGNFMNLSLKLCNVSENVANKIKIGDFNVLDENNNLICNSQNCIVEKTSLLGGEYTRVKFNNSQLNGNNLKVSFQLTYEDKYNECHEYTITTVIEDLNNYKLKFNMIKN